MALIAAQHESTWSMTGVSFCCNSQLAGNQSLRSEAPTHSVRGARQWAPVSYTIHWWHVLADAHLQLWSGSRANISAALLHILFLDENQLPRAQRVRSGNGDLSFRRCKQWPNPGHRWMVFKIQKTMDNEKGCGPEDQNIPKPLQNLADEK